jgi:MinD-like ATPase involved in chromosome partitioning or flagellar assembly
MSHPTCTVCWAAKGGSGATVVAAALALTAERPVLLVDLAGDLPATLGIPEPGGPGVHDWLHSDAGAAQLRDLELPVADGVVIVPAGGRRGDSTDRWIALADALLADRRTVVVDAGTGEPPGALMPAADRSLLVTRACYLSLRHAVALRHRPTGVVLVDEPGRALRRHDIEAALGAPVVAKVPIDPSIARAVDAGLLTTRLPRVIERDLRGAA